MSSNKKTARSRSVVTRLTLWYALICTVFSITVFTTVSIRMNRNASRRIDSELKGELREFAFIYADSGIDGLQEEFDRESISAGLSKIFCRLLAPDGTPLATSDTSRWILLAQELKNTESPTADVPILHSLYSKDKTLNARIAAIKTPDGKTIQMGINLQTENHYNRKIQKVLILSSLLMLLLSTFSVWLIATRAMAGVRRVTRAVSEIRKDSLNHQVPACNEGREIQDLVNEFNRMLQRIETLVHELKEVSDNVAHDLRSPITRMRGIAETTLTGPASIDAHRDMGSTIIEECDRLTQMINTMLEIAQAESGLLEIAHSPLELNTLLKDAIELFGPVADEKQIELLADLPADPLVIYGDKTRLQRVIANLLDNAIKFTPARGTVSAAAIKTSDHIIIKVSDSGPGIAPTNIERIFDRFYRGEKSRSSAGNGLGLSLARTIVETHHGTIHVQNNTGTTGCTVTIHLPTGTDEL